MKPPMALMNDINIGIDLEDSFTGLPKEAFMHHYSRSGRHQATEGAVASNAKVA